MTPNSHDATKLLHSIHKKWAHTYRHGNLMIYDPNKNCVCFIHIAFILMSMRDFYCYCTLGLLILYIYHHCSSQTKTQWWKILWPVEHKLCCECNRIKRIIFQQCVKLRTVDNLHPKASESLCDKVYSQCHTLSAMTTCHYFEKLITSA